MYTQSTIPISIADQQPIFLTGVTELLRQRFSIELLHEVDNADRLFQILEKQYKGLLLIDFSLIENRLVEFKTALHKQNNCKIILLFSQQRKYQVIKSFNLRILGYLSKSCSPTELTKAIETILKGEKYYCNSILNILLESKLAPQPEQITQQLTTREQQIARYIAQGKKNKEIADLLHLSPHTIHTHRKNIMKKIGASSALELSHYALKTGLIVE